jgi:hypothetical protein
VYIGANTMERIAQLDEEYAKKVDEILEGDTDKVPMRVQISLTMAMQSQILRALNRVNASVNQVMDKQDIANGRTGKLESEIIELKKKNIINWVILNPKSAIMWFIVSFFTLEVVAHEFTSAENIAFVLGVVRKWLGL